MRLRRDAEARGGVAIDRERDAEPRGLEIARRRRAARAACAAPQRAAAPTRRARAGSASSSVYWYCVRLTRRVDLEVLHRLQVTSRRRRRCASFGLQARDDLRRRRACARSRGLSVIEMRPAVRRRVRAVGADERRDALDVRDRRRTTSATALLELHHPRERHVGRRLRDADDRGRCPAAGRIPSARRPREAPVSTTVAIVDEQRRRAGGAGPT